MAITHASSGDVIKAQPLGSALSSTQSHALVKGARLEVIRVVLGAGKALPPHHVAGDLTLYCIEGSLEFSMPERKEVLAPGDLLFLSGHEPYAVTALKDSSALLTLSLPAKEQGQQ